MYVPPDLSDFDELIYRTGRIARAEVLLQYANEQLFFALVGRTSRAVDSLSGKSHTAFLTANARMFAASDFDHDLKKIGSAAFKRARSAIAMRDEVVHGAFVLLEERGRMIRINSRGRGNFHWTAERFDDAHTALRRSWKSIGALQELVESEDTRNVSLRLIASDSFALYSDNTATASTQEGKRTDPEMIPV